MAAIEIGSKGLKEVNLTIPQETSLSFLIVHKDSEGHVIDHTGDTANMAFESADKELFVDLDACVDMGAENIAISIPASVSADLPLGKLNWDIIVTMAAEQLRLCYGKVSIVDTYALDE